MPIIIETDPLPLEPATWMDRYAPWGSPSLSHNARILSSLKTGPLSLLDVHETEEEGVQLVGIREAHGHGAKSMMVTTGEGQEGRRSFA